MSPERLSKCCLRERPGMKGWLIWFWCFIQVSINRHTAIARFGIMHMVATNLCIWLNVLVEETKHRIHHVTHLQHELAVESHHGEKYSKNFSFVGFFLDLILSQYYSGQSSLQINFSATF